MPMPVEPLLSRINVGRPPKGSQAHIEANMDAGSTQIWLRQKNAREDADHLSRLNGQKFN